MGCTPKQYCHGNTSRRSIGVGIFVIILIFSFFSIHTLSGETLPDSDNDGLLDRDEIKIYHTDAQNADTDGDGFSDGLEIKNGYSPLKGAGATLGQIDTDNDGLSDRFELAFGTDLGSSDTDKDGFKDKSEIVSGYDPRTPLPVKITKKIQVYLAKQRMEYYVNTVVLATYTISSGKWNWPTPTGEFKIINKSPRAWSKLAGLWMPYWMGFAGGKFGIHDLPEWPNGTKEGASHLGKPVSHGCIRLGTAQAKEVYTLTPVGTKLIVRNN